MVLKIYNQVKITSGYFCLVWMYSNKKVFVFHILCVFAQAPIMPAATEHSSRQSVSGGWFYQLCSPNHMILPTHEQTENEQP